MRLRRRRARRKAGLAVVALLVVLLIAFSLIERAVGPILYAYVEVEAQQMVVGQISRAVAELAGDVQYRDLYYFERDSDNRITFIQPNTPAINRLAAQANLKIIESMRTMDGHRVYIPMGALTGSRLLANYGPRLPVRVSLIGRVQVDIGDKFEAAGVNQTRHVLYLDTKAAVRMTIPLWTSDINVTAYNPVAEAIIPGQVPGTYLNLVVPGGSSSGTGGTSPSSGASGSKGP
ncbi:MAG TPA: sporulation protein YunB [Bacillota bacterium]